MRHSHRHTGRSTPQSRTLAIALLAVTLLAAGGAASGETELPPEECVRLLRSARIAHLRGDTAAEFELLRSAAKRFPDEVAPLYSLLEANRAHPQAGDEAGRVRDLLIARLDDPARPLPVAALEGIRANVSDPELLSKTAHHIERRLETQPSTAAELLRIQADLRNDLGDKPAAAESWAKLLDLEFSETVAWSLYRAYAELERWDEASATFEKLLGDSAGTLDAQLRPVYARLLARAEKFDELHRQIDRHAGAAGDDPRGAVWLHVLEDAAWDLRDAGKDEEAKALFQKAADLAPEDEEARARLIYLYGTASEREELAAAEGERWRDEIDPNILFEEGTNKLAAGDAAGAVELLRRAAPEFPNLEAAWYNLGMAAFRVEDWPTALSAFARSRELNPERAESCFFHGMALFQLSRCKEAVESLQRALALDPARNQAHYYLATCYRQLGDEEAAARHSRLYAESSGG